MKKVMIMIVLTVWTMMMAAQTFQMRSTSMYNQQTAVSASSMGTQVSAPGAAAPAAMYTTTYDQPTSHARKVVTPDDDDEEEEGYGEDVGDFTPIGAPLLPLVLLAVGYGVVRKRKE